jgi:hypothetical protein
MFPRTKNDDRRGKILWNMHSVTGSDLLWYFHPSIKFSIIYTALCSKMMVYPN